MSKNPPVWIGTSWKMTKTLAEATSFVDQLLDAPVPAGVQAFLVPAHTALATVRNRLPADSGVLLGAQNAHWAAEGAGTGEISMRMARDAGADLVMIGHAERREQFGETDQIVAAKARAAVDADLLALVCVGETRAQREQGEADTVVAVQLVTALSRLDLPELSRVLIAYEPVWAIGEYGRPATATEVEPVLRAIRTALAGLRREPSVRAVLYGGSVDAETADALLAVPGVDGLFVGRAGWDAAGFRRLLDIGAAHARPSFPASAPSGNRPLVATGPESRSS